MAPQAQPPENSSDISILLYGSSVSACAICQLFQILQQEEQVKRIRRTWFEIELLVPAAHGVVFCMHDQRSNSCDVRGLCCPYQGVLEKGFANARSLL